MHTLLFAISIVLIFSCKKEAAIVIPLRSAITFPIKPIPKELLPFPVGVRPLTDSADEMPQQTGTPIIVNGRLFIKH